MGGAVTQNLMYYVVLKKSVNYRDVFDCCVSSGQATGIKYVYLNSPKNEDFADLNIIYKKLVFRKTENFLPNFCPP